MNKIFDDILSEKAKELPSRAPGERLWKAIEAALDTEDAIERQLADLPLHSPSPRTWEAIDAALSAHHGKAVRRRFLYAAAAAAAVLLLLILPRLVNTGRGIVVENEIVMSEAQYPGMILNRDNEDPIEMIISLCKTGTPACQTTLFREKLQLYEELNEDIRQLETVIGQVGDSPEIIQSVIRMENLKSSTLRELIQLIHS